MRLGTRKRFLWRPILRIFVLSGASFILGCVGYPDRMPPHFQKIGGRANTFRMFVIEPFGLFAEKERVRVIRVFDFETDMNSLKNRRLCWEIVAATDVRAARFELVAGQVPQGFIQIFPPAGETFKPIPGRAYEITAVMAHPLASPWGVETKWVAEGGIEHIDTRRGNTQDSYE